MLQANAESLSVLLIRLILTLYSCLSNEFRCTCLCKPTDGGLLVPVDPSLESWLVDAKGCPPRFLVDPRVGHAELGGHYRQQVRGGLGSTAFPLMGMGSCRSSDGGGVLTPPSSRVALSLPQNTWASNCRMCCTQLPAQ